MPKKRTFLLRPMLALAAAVLLALLANSLSGDAAAQGYDIPLVAHNEAPRGLWADGDTLWVTDWQRRKLYAYRLHGETPRPSHDLVLARANASPWGIWSDGATVWVTDSEDSRLYAYDLAASTGRRRGIREAAQDIVLDPGNAHPVGLWSDGFTVWVADWGDATRLYAYDLYGGVRQADQDIVLAADNAQPRGLWSDGTTLWVADAAAGQLFAYDLWTAPGSPYPVEAADQAIALDWSNTAVRGIWSDGVTLWVVNDGVPGEVFAYDVSDFDIADLPPPSAGDGLPPAEEESQVSGREAWQGAESLAAPRPPAGGGGQLQAASPRFAPAQVSPMQATEPSAIALDANNRHPSGLWSDATTLWVSDILDAKLSAYALDGGARQAGQGVRPARRQLEPQGHLVRRRNHLGGQ